MRKKTPNVTRKAPTRASQAKTTADKIDVLEEQVASLTKAHSKLLSEKQIRTRVERETEHLIEEQRELIYQRRKAEDHARATDAEVLRLKRTINSWIDRCRILSGTKEGEHERFPRS